MPFEIYLHLLRKYRWRMLTFIAVATTAAGLGFASLPKQYSATAVLRVDPTALRTMGENSGNVGEQVTAERLLATEAVVAASPGVVAQTIRELKLYDAPEFTPRDRQGRALATEPSLADFKQVLRQVTKQISVEQPLNTDLLSVSFRSRSPQLSADVANGLLNSLIQLDLTTRVRELLGAASSMNAQLATLRSQMEASQRALVEYEGTHDILQPDSKDNIAQASLDQSNVELNAAQAKRIQLQAEYIAVQSGDLDALMALDPTKKLVPLHEQLLDAQARLARIAQVDGPNHPLYREQEAVVTQSEAALRSAQAHLTKQIQVQYRTALAQEALLAKKLDREKSAMGSFNLKAIQYNALKAAADSYSNLYYQLQQNVQNATVAATLRAGGLAIIGNATPDPVPVYPRPVLYTLIALLAATLLAAGAAVLAGVLDRSVSNPDQVEMWLGVPVLASLPLDKSKAGLPRADAWLLGTGAKESAGDSSRNAGPFHEAILSLRSALLFAQQETQVLAVTSSAPEEGKSTVASNLAAALALGGKRTVLMDVDLRRPTVHRRLHLSNQVGVTSLFAGTATLSEALHPVAGSNTLFVVTAGPTLGGPRDLLRFGLGEVIQKLREDFDHVILDCPPLIGFAEVGMLAREADGALLVAHAGSTERPQLLAAIRQLRGVQARILGVILNRVSATVNPYYKYYTNYDNRYYSEAANERD